MTSLRAEPYAGHRCRCVLRDPDDDGFVSPCGQLVRNPDQPVCDACMAAGHMARGCVLAGPDE